MANIQQSVNSILSSAQGAAFLFSQSPYIKRKELEQAEARQATRELEAEARKGEVLQQEADILGKNIDEDYMVLPSLERSKELDIDLYQHNLTMFKKTGDDKYIQEALKYTPLQRKKNYDDIIENEIATESAKEQAAASKSAEASYSQRAYTLQNTIDIVKANHEYLSAKQRGQLETMVHTLNKKGVLK